MTVEFHVIPASRPKLTLVALGAAAFVFVCVWLPTIVFSWELYLAVIIGVPFFTACFVQACRQLLSPKPAVIITDRGIVDNSSGLSAGLIPWEEIAGISFTSYQSQRFLGIELKDPERLLSRLPRWKRAVMRLNARIGFSIVNIPQVTIAMPLGELYDLIVSYRPELRRAS